MVGKERGWWIKKVDKRQRKRMVGKERGWLVKKEDGR